MAKRDWTEAIEMYNAGIRVASICGECKCTPTALYAALALNNVPLRSEVRGSSAHGGGEGRENVLSRYPQSTIDKVVKMLDKGEYTAAEIAKTEHMKYYHVLRIAHEHQITLHVGRSSRAWKAARVKVLQDYKDPTKKIADVLNDNNITMATLYKIISVDESTKALSNQLKDSMKSGGRGRISIEAIIEEVQRRIQQGEAMNEVVVQLPLF